MAGPLFIFVYLLFALAVPGSLLAQESREKIVIAGAASLVPLAEKYSAGFRKEHPAVEVEIRGGGSNFAVEAVRFGKIDVGLVARTLDGPEKADLYTQAIGLDAIIVLSYPSNSVANLSLQQIRDIYQGKIATWKALRGEELVETEKKRAAMAHMIAHDLKNPLLGIKKTLERLEQAATEPDGKSTKKTLQELVSAGDLVIGMVNEMLDLYRSDFGELPLSLTSFPIDEAIQTSLRILGPELEEKELHVHRSSEPDRISVVADKRRLTRLITNLLSNAIKFSPAHGRITISTTRPMNGAQAAPHILLCVEDQGAGLPAQDLGKIFDLFYSRDQGKTETGTGLGLPYCKLVAEAHGGKIWAESRDSGGLAVSVLLPTNVEAESGVHAP